MIIDISQPLSPGMAGFPGDAAYEENRTFAMGPGCPVNVARIAMSTHCGSHADAPLHYDAAGAAIGALALEPFIGPCRVIDARAAGLLCLPELISGMLEDVPPRVLLRLAERSDPHIWPTGFRALAAEVIVLLAAKGVRLVGVDTPSVDPENSKELPAHMAAKRAGMRILENLVLGHVVPGDYELIALPINLANLDAAPVRAVLRQT
jgi:arylformamidase